MKAIFIILTIITCLSPLFVGSGYGIYKLFEKTTTKPTTPKSTTSEPIIIEIEPRMSALVMPKPSNLTSLEPTTPGPITPKPTPVYQWMKYSPELTNKKKLVRPDKYDTIIIGRLIYSDGNQIPCEVKISYTDETIVPHPEKKITDYKELEVLLAERDHYKFEKSSNGRVKENAIEGGKMNNETVYICRVHWKMKYYDAGMMQPSSHFCRTGFPRTNATTTYELLTFN
ncbi:hypothetical protein PV327_003095 [Microctonus hyperodae]|uniref:Uncharacterized protein n=1 Tax=Microctonus hyperodae TaxID=165561 RepID=A0AA39L0J3_MICHY|nr:hypothetical protein PV327_003095 [Microctonus hyperodae]